MVLDIEISIVLCHPPCLENSIFIKLKAWKSRKEGKGEKDWEWANNKWRKIIKGSYREPEQASEVFGFLLLWWWCVRDFINFLQPWRPFLESAAATAAKSLQSCLTPCDPIDGSPPGSSVPGILQARTLEWVAVSFSNAWGWKGKVKLLSRVQLLAIPWTAAYQAPPSMGFSRQEYWSRVPLPSPILESRPRVKYIGIFGNWGAASQIAANPLLPAFQHILTLSLPYPECSVPHTEHSNLACWLLP